MIFIHHLILYNIRNNPLPRYTLGIIPGRFKIVLSWDYSVFHLVKMLCNSQLKGQICILKETKLPIALNYYRRGKFNF